jgi:lipopolysaccharide/colanic/teichoic acid biosynthesis glycosyltransferase
MLKRSFDVCCAAIGLLFLSPLFLYVSLWIKYDSAGPVFFRQWRVGRNGVPFLIHKFRTMRIESDNKSLLTIGNDNRVTRPGVFLRKSKVDELPQLIDVLFGKMSLVGPRPEVQEFIDHYPEDVKKIVLSVRPGITDRASIDMVDENILLAEYKDPRQAYIEHILPLKQKFYLEYVEKNSFLGDISIILDTIMKIIKR